jgi:hypothetical protein
MPVAHFISGNRIVYEQRFLGDVLERWYAVKGSKYQVVAIATAW